MEETTTSTREGMIEKAEEYANALRLLGVLPQIENLLEDMAYELRAVIQRKPVERFEDDPPGYVLNPSPEELRPVKEVPDYMRMVYIDEFTRAVRWDIDAADQCGCSEEYIKGKQSALDAIDDINYYEARSIKCPKCSKQFMTIDNDIGKFIYCPCCGEAVK